MQKFNSPTNLLKNLMISSYSLDFAIVTIFFYGNDQPVAVTTIHLKNKQRKNNEQTQDVVCLSV